MKLNIRGEKITVTQSMKNYITEKLDKVDKYFENPEEINANVLVRIKGLEQIIEVTALTKKFTLRAEESNEDFYAAVDLVVAKLERQMRKNKERLNNKYKNVTVVTHPLCCHNLSIIRDKNTSTKEMIELAYKVSPYLDLSYFDVSSATTFNSMFFASESLKTILVSHNWNETFKDGAITDWMFENCYALMGDIAYRDMNDAAEPGSYEHMTGIYATTNGGYLTMKHEESEDDEFENSLFFNKLGVMKFETNIL